MCLVPTAMDFIPGGIRYGIVARLFNLKGTTISRSDAVVATLYFSPTGKEKKNIQKSYPPINIIIAIKISKNGYMQPLARYDTVIFFR